jgi:hypothetical protein
VALLAVIDQRLRPAFLTARLAAGFALFGAGFALARAGFGGTRAGGALFFAPPRDTGRFAEPALALPLRAPLPAADGAGRLAAALLRTGAAGFAFAPDPLRTAATALVTRRVVTFT